MKTYVPELRPGPWLWLSIICTVLAVSVLLFAFFVSPLLRPLGPLVERWLPRSGGAVLLAVNFWLGIVVCVPVSNLALSYLLPPLSIHFPSEDITVRDAVILAARDPQAGRRNTRVMPRRVQWGDANTWYALRRALAEAVGVRPRAVRRDSRLMGDLGVGGPLCRKCGYDVRDAVSVCPECGTPVTRAVMEGAPASSVI